MNAVTATISAPNRPWGVPPPPDGSSRKAFAIPMETEYGEGPSQLQGGGGWSRRHRCKAGVCAGASSCAITGRSTDRFADSRIGFLLEH